MSSFNSKEYHRQYYLRNKEKFLEKAKESSQRRKAADPEAFLEKSRIACRKWYAKNADYDNARNREFRKANAVQETHRKRGRRQNIVENSSLPGLPAEHAARMKEISAARPDGWHNDHIYPVKGRSSCGLHVW